MPVFDGTIKLACNLSRLREKIAAEIVRLQVMSASFMIDVVPWLGLGCPGPYRT